MTEQEALRLALEALETPWNAPYVDGCDLALGKKMKAITAIKEALAQPDYRAVKTYHEGKPVYVAQSEQKPVAHLWQHGETGRTRIVMPDQIITADANWFVVGPLILGTSPPQPHQEQNLNCKSVQARLAAAWGYTKVLDISDKRLMEMPPQQMHPEIKKMYEDYFDKCFRESSEPVPENFMDALKFDVAVRDAREWEKVDMREHAEGNLGIGTAPPPQREWVGLTDEEVAYFSYVLDHWTTTHIRAIEALLKAKNEL